MVAVCSKHDDRAQYSFCTHGERCKEVLALHHVRASRRHALPRDPVSYSVTAIMEEEEQELRNPYPSPPSNYTNHTSQNIAALALLRERIPDGDISVERQREVLDDQTDVPDWPLVNLEPPRFDWIVEEGKWTVFGEIWNVRRPYKPCIHN